MCLFNLFLHGYSSLGFAFKKLLVIKVNHSFFSSKSNHKRSWLRQIQTYLFWPCFAKNFHIAWLGRWTHISLLCIGFVVVCRPQIRLLYMARREFVIQERGLRRPLYLWSASTSQPLQEMLRAHHLFEDVDFRTISMQTRKRDSVIRLISWRWQRVRVLCVGSRCS